jgi:bla regulator protein blaR1
MELFNESHIILIALGKTIVHSIWIGLLILGFLRFFLHTISADLSNLRYAVSVLALFLLLTSLIAAFIIVYEPADMGKSISSLSFRLLPGAASQSVSVSSSLFSMFAYLYFAGTLFMLFRSAISLNYVRGLRKSSSRISPAWQNRFFRISKSMGLRRKIDLLVSHRIKSPLLIGFIKPAVIVPAGMLTHMPLAQIETLLIHELYHLKRRDHLVNIVQLFLEGILFYNPAVWIISSYIRNEREHCCDDKVLLSTKDPLCYASALVHVADQQQFTQLSPGVAGTSLYQFNSRIKRILNRNIMRTTMREKVISLALMAGSVILLLTVSSFSAGPSIFRFKTMSHELNLSSPEASAAVYSDTIPLKNRASESELEQEIEDAKEEALQEIEEIDWEEMREEIEIDMESVRVEIENIDWDQVKVDMELSLSEMKLDLEEMKAEIEISIKEINWDEIEKELEEAKFHIDSLKIELDL